jgi:release factor glutamine methyltransferase
VSVRAALAEAARRLETVPGAPRLDAEILMAHALGVERSDLLLRHLDDPAPAAFAGLVARRLAHEPVAYITGRAGFWTIELEVGPGALIPRGDSGALLEAAVAHFGAEGPGSILDLGTGPGTLLLAALTEWPRARGLGIDASETALGYARRNAARLGLEDRAVLRRGDWADGIDARFDLILCNPPYIGADEPLAPSVHDHEPHGALYAGADGLDAYRRIAPALPRLLAPGGLAAFEIGLGRQDEVAALLAAQGFTISSWRDLNGHIRCLACTA